MSHSHSHSHGGGHDDEHADAHNHVHDHTEDLTPALQNLLYAQIDFSHLHTLNEDESGSGKAICQKTWAQRLELQPELCSAADEQVLMIVPFTGQIRLHSLLIRSSPSPSSPKTLHLFLNPPEAMDFETASDKEPTQTVFIAQTTDVQEIPVKRVLFNTTRALALFFSDNWSDGDEDVTRISYLAFKGDYMRLNKEPVSVMYEMAANPADHKAIVGTGSGVGWGVQ